MERLKQLYKELHKNVYFDQKSYKETALSHFVAMRGRRYDENKSVRFMTVGRAVNGWGDSMSHLSSEAYAEEAARLFDNSNRFQDEWKMKFDNGEPYSEYVDGNGTTKRYYLSKSPFWSTSMEVYRGLSDSKENNCYEDFVWNNIYKVAPKDAGNPSTNLIYAQAETCVKILKEEIRLLNPTHVLLVVDKSWLSWTSRNKVMFDFMKAFEVYECCCQSIDDQDKAIVQCAFKADGRKVLVTSRPETVDRKRYVNAVVNAFGKIQ